MDGNGRSNANFPWHTPHVSDSIERRDPRVTHHPPPPPGCCIEISNDAVRDKSGTLRSAANARSMDAVRFLLETVTFLCESSPAMIEILVEPGILGVAVVKNKKERKECISSWAC